MIAPVVRVTYTDDHLPRARVVRSTALYQSIVLEFGPILARLDWLPAQPSQRALQLLHRVVGRNVCQPYGMLSWPGYGSASQAV